jgi:hypothetical protein
VTGQKYAAKSPPVVYQKFGLEPRDRIRPVVAALGSEVNWEQLRALYSSFVEIYHDPTGLPAGRPELGTMQKICLDTAQEFFWDRRSAQVARPFALQRLRSPEHGGYPLRRTLLVIFNREQGHVTADLKEVSSILGIRGMGVDEASALGDLERHFDRLVREKVRIPPHAQHEQDNPIRIIVDFLVDWEQFARENPSPRLLLGRVIKPADPGPMKVQWIFGPQGIRHQALAIPRQYENVYFTRLARDDWFKAVVLEFPNRVEWIEPPAKCADPKDPAMIQAAWDAIPRFAANEPDIWPMKET